ncbi:MAG: hypothetical protein NZ533_00135 [Casimicrobiaceae bacterium]|nr:hypothetical protein [Casimicrobiaceae bacterium]MCX8098711.1 hypothetical protein [Casimicrobiaceae bacterium]MDW8312150.1 hypothetical protein [Burkholderiales bacterium]
MKQDDLSPELDPGQVEPVLAGTLALLTHASECSCPLVAARITSNLNRLASCPHLSPPFRLLCSNLARVWDARRLRLSAPGEKTAPADPNPETDAVPARTPHSTLH